MYGWSTHSRQWLGSLTIPEALSVVTLRRSTAQSGGVFPLTLYRWASSGIPSMLHGVIVENEAARKRGIWARCRRCGGSCYEDCSGCVVVGVGEPVGDSS